MAPSLSIFLGVGIQSNIPAINCLSQEESPFANKGNTPHSTVKYNKFLCVAFMTEFEICQLCLQYLFKSCHTLRALHRSLAPMNEKFLTYNIT